ncbi:MAG: hypothetical protein M1816_001077 [Peltula sp. TS41687]|nr:MAG: hypothetical protein M1816_001077 [Peltula sp. TS41687]
MFSKGYSTAVICFVIFSFGRGGLGRSNGLRAELAQSSESAAPLLFKRDLPAHVDPGVSTSGGGSGGESNGEFWLGDESQRITPSFGRSDRASTKPARPARPPVSKTRPPVSNGQCALGRYQGIQGTSRHVTPKALSRQECQSYDWDGSRTTEWLVDYWQTRSPQFKSSPGGMVTLLRGELIGDGVSTCNLFSAENCDFNKCRDQMALAAASPCDRDPGSNVLLSIQNVQSWFLGTISAYTQGIESLSLLMDHLATTFYVDQSQQDYSNFKQLMTLANIIVGCIAPLAPQIKIFLSAIPLPLFQGAKEWKDATFIFGPHLFANTQVLFLSNAGNPYDCTLHSFDLLWLTCFATRPSNAPVAAGDVGALMESQLTGVKSSLMRLHDDLFRGLKNKVTGMTLLDWIGQGNFHGVLKLDVPALTDKIRNVMIAKAIDVYYSTQRIYILGGQPCDPAAPDGSTPPNVGFGTAPKIGQGSYCYKNRLYSIYYWRSSIDAAQRIQPLNYYRERRWGWVTNPPGMLSLGKGSYAGITLADVIKSSVDAWEAAGRRNTYDADNAARLLRETSRDPQKSIYHQGPAWPGVFRVPVSDDDGGWASLISLKSEG